MLVCGPGALLSWDCGVLVCLGTCTADMDALHPHLHIRRLWAGRGGVFGCYRCQSYAACYLYLLSISYTPLCTKTDSFHVYFPRKLRTGLSPMIRWSF